MFNSTKNYTIMNINKTKNYGEFVEITAPVQHTEEKTPNVLGGEIWYN